MKSCFLVFCQQKKKFTSGVHFCSRNKGAPIVCYLVIKILISATRLVSVRPPQKMWNSFEAKSSVFGRFAHWHQLMDIRWHFDFVTWLSTNIEFKFSYFRAGGAPAEWGELLTCIFFRMRATGTNKGKEAFYFFKKKKEKKFLKKKNNVLRRPKRHQLLHLSNVSNVRGSLTDENDFFFFNFLVLPLWAARNRIWNFFSFRVQNANTGHCDEMISIKFE